MSAGKVLQVVQEYDSSFPRAQTNSTTFVATTFKVTITPTEASSKILIDFRFISNSWSRFFWIRLPKLKEC